MTSNAVYAAFELLKIEVPAIGKQVLLANRTKKE
jgi:hypothetical protein